MKLKKYILNPISILSSVVLFDGPRIYDLIINTITA